jgi:GNAT superfamily N-acetyltransferase
MLPGEEGAVCNLVRGVFDSEVASFFNKKGRRSFREYADPDKLSGRVAEDYFVVLALSEGRILGMIEMRCHGHCSLLFVETEFQGRGIAARLLGRAVALCSTSGLPVKEVTVNSSPSARRTYERMGFGAIGPAQVINGVRSVPMKKVLY